MAFGYSQAEFADIMGNDGADTVKATLHRMRAILLGIAEEAGLEVDWQEHPRVY